MKITTEVTKVFNVSLTEEDTRKLLEYLSDTFVEQEDLDEFAQELYCRLEKALDGGDDL